MATKSIYGLVDPRDGSVRYVGASESPALRYGQHLKRTSPPMREWLDDLGKVGMSPDLRFFTGPVENWREVEANLQHKHAASLLKKEEQSMSVELGPTLSIARRNAGMTQAAAAAALDTTPTTISRYESGEREPSIANLVGLANAYGVAVQDLIEGGIHASEGASEDARKARE